MKCWNCGQVGHSQKICKAPKSNLRFAPDSLPDNFRVAMIEEGHYHQYPEEDAYSTAGSMMAAQDPQNQVN